MAKNKNEAAVPEDSFELLVDGRVSVVVDGEEWLLRRPKIGEFRKLRERIWETQDQKVIITDRFRKEAKAKAEELAKADEMTRTIESQRFGHRLTADLEELNEQWVREAFDLLAARPAPEAIDIWPTWLRESDFIGSLLEHWRAVPLARGAR